MKRIVDTAFWFDEKIMELSPEDKYFMIYILTNPHSSQLGIYKLVPKTASFELGWSVDSVLNLLDRFESKYQIIKYNHITKEIAIKNYLVYSIIKGGKPVEDLLLKELGTFTEQQMQVCYLMRIGLAKPQIQNMTNLSRATVWRWVKKYDWVLTSDNDMDIE